MKSLSNVFFLFIIVTLGFETFGLPISPSNEIIRVKPINLVPPLTKDIVCPRVMYANQTYGNIQTPDFPAKYPNNAECSYFVTAPLGMLVTVLFDVFETEACCDYVKIYDGSNNKNDANLIKKLSGSQSGAEFSTKTSNMMEVVFYSDANTNLQGFHAIFEFSDARVSDPGFSEYQCSQNFTEPFGVIVSPNFPQQYPPNADCTYTIGDGREGTHVAITIIEFNTEACCDHLKAYEGRQRSDDGLLMDMSGPLVPMSTFQSDGNFMFLEFTSDGNGQEAGYSIKYEIIEESHNSVTARSLRK